MYANFWFVVCDAPILFSTFAHAKWAKRRKSVYGVPLLAFFVIPVSLSHNTISPSLSFYRVLALSPLFFSPLSSRRVSVSALRATAAVALAERTVATAGQGNLRYSIFSWKRKQQP